MIFKPYGQSGMKVSAVGFGGMRFDTSRDMEENADLLHYAFSRGVNYFDTAPGYCENKSARIFGHAFKHMKGVYYVSTKRMPDERDTVQSTVDMVKRALETLNRGYIDVFHVWNLRSEEQYQLAVRPGGLYDGLQKAKSLRLIRHIAFSSHQNGEAIRRNFERNPFDGVLLGMNILNFPYRWDGVEAAIANGAGVAVMNPLYGGMIPKYADKLPFLAQNGETPVQTALRFVIGTPQISTALVGFTNKAQIDMACDVSESDNVGITKDALEQIRANLSSNMTEACTGCGYCKNCPQNILIPPFMLFYNQRHVFGVSEADMVKEVYAERQFGASMASMGRPGDCIKCGNCEKACTQRLPIIERMEKLAAWGL